MPTKKKRTHLLRRTFLALGILFLLLNVVAALHAWRFTHFAKSGMREKNPGQIPFATKLRYTLTGIDNPRPAPGKRPVVPFDTITVRGPQGRLAVWKISPEDSSGGAVVLFHGYGGEKSGMLGKAMFCRSLGYTVYLADFYGGGESEGSTCTIGFKEAGDVKAVWDFARQCGEKTIVLYGTSMGAVAILKCISDTKLQPAGVVLECPYATMYGTVCTRFRMVRFPEVPMAALLTFWGGVEHGFWAFGHNPDDYAKAIVCPTLMLWGEKDDRVSRGEIDAVYRRLRGPKMLQVLPSAAHNDYLHSDSANYVAALRNFLPGL